MHPRYTKINSMNTKYQAAAGLAQAKGQAGPCPGTARPLAWAGPASAWYFVLVLYIVVNLRYIWIYPFWIYSFWIHPFGGPRL